MQVTVRVVLRPRVWGRHGSHALGVSPHGLAGVPRGAGRRSPGMLMGRADVRCPFQHHGANGLLRANDERRVSGCWGGECRADRIRGGPQRGFGSFRAERARRGLARGRRSLHAPLARGALRGGRRRTCLPRRRLGEAASLEVHPGPETAQPGQGAHPPRRAVPGQRRQRCERPVGLVRAREGALLGRLRAEEHQDAFREAGAPAAAARRIWAHCERRHAECRGAQRQIPGALVQGRGRVDPREHISKVRAGVTWQRTLVWAVPQPLPTLQPLHRLQGLAGESERQNGVCAWAPEPAYVGPVRHLVGFA
mmetsp:Transcript_30404/g.85089  ORF Transcript_30404/g.85089 Transcript_30404/m.85089 type:complete len:309 (+) Transcript_30404:2279-3205(+)